MSERLKNFEQDDSPREESSPHHEVHKPAVEKDVSKHEKLDVEKSREHVERVMKSSHEQNKDDPHKLGSSAADSPPPAFEPPAVVLRKTLKAIRQNLTPSERTFSKFIHSPVIYNVSELTSKTLARPYAILSGGIVAIIGSAGYLYYSKHLGYKYNYFVPLLLFAVGLVAGVIVELTYKNIARNKNSK